MASRASTASAYSVPEKLSPNAIAVRASSVSASACCSYSCARSTRASANAAIVHGRTERRQPGIGAHDVDAGVGERLERGLEGAPHVAVHGRGAAEVDARRHPQAARVERRVVEARAGR